MKKSLKDKLASSVLRMEERAEMLKRHVREYKIENKLQEAVYSQIKLDQFEMIIADLKETLNNN